MQLLPFLWIYLGLTFLHHHDMFSCIMLLTIDKPDKFMSI